MQASPSSNSDELNRIILYVLLGLQVIFSLGYANEFEDYAVMFIITVIFFLTEIYFLYVIKKKKVIGSVTINYSNPWYSILLGTHTLCRCGRRNLVHLVVTRGRKP